MKENDLKNRPKINGEKIKGKFVSSFNFEKLWTFKPFIVFFHIDTYSAIKKDKDFQKILKQDGINELRFCDYIKGKLTVIKKIIL